MRCFGTFFSLVYLTSPKTDVNHSSKNDVLAFYVTNNNTVNNIRVSWHSMRSESGVGFRETNALLRKNPALALMKDLTDVLFKASTKENGLHMLTNTHENNVFKIQWDDIRQFEDKQRYAFVVEFYMVDKSVEKFLMIIQKSEILNLSIVSVRRFTDDTIKLMEKLETEKNMQTYADGMDILSSTSTQIRSVRFPVKLTQ